jgi:hypothetical protein
MGETGRNVGVNVKVGVGWDDGFADAAGASTGDDREVGGEARVGESNGELFER